MTFTPEEIAAMAEKMAICISADSFEFTNDGLLEFAELVAEKAAAQEREAIRAALIQEYREWGELYEDSIEDVIRARGQKE